MLIDIDEIIQYINLNNVDLKNYHLSDEELRDIIAYIISQKLGNNEAVLKKTEEVKEDKKIKQEIKIKVLLNFLTYTKEQGERFIKENIDKFGKIADQKKIEYKKNKPEQKKSFTENERLKHKPMAQNIIEKNSVSSGNFYIHINVLRSILEMQIQKLNKMTTSYNTINTIRYKDNQYDPQILYQTNQNIAPNVSEKIKEVKDFIQVLKEIIDNFKQKPMPNKVSQQTR